MIRLLTLLIVGDWHRHMWMIHSEARIFETQTANRPIASKYVVRCTECGCMKAYKL